MTNLVTSIEALTHNDLKTTTTTKKLQFSFVVALAFKMYSTIIMKREKKLLVLSSA